ncbi:MAG: hypothetical protein LBQ20_02825 [Rhodanobacter sp.]|jgi:hypothetical protein|nr:hypothetical protein [Rhodanobacter sp.]
MTHYWKFFTFALIVLTLAACHHGGPKPDLLKSSDVPQSFDVTIYATKDNQFDFEDAPLATEDLKSAFRYRQEESLPMATVLLKPSEKEKIKKEHIVALATVAYQMHIRAFMEDRGEIAEIRGQAKAPDTSKRKDKTKSAAE